MWKGADQCIQNGIGVRTGTLQRAAQKRVKHIKGWAEVYVYMYTV
jgi:hypothetical protein